MKLSQNFTLEELCVTDTGLTNKPSIEEEEKLLYLANFILQPIRNKWGRIRVNSGFRSLLVNTKIGGAKTSQHLDGEAADIAPMTPGLSIEVVWDWCCKYLAYGQCILEDSKGAKWIHISLPRIGGVNQQAMTYRGGKYELVG